VHHIVLGVPAWLEEEYRQSLLTFQSAEASEELLLRKRASLAESLLAVDQVDVPPALLSFILAPFAFGAHLLAFSLHLLITFSLSRRDNTPCPGSPLPAPSGSSTGTTVLFTPSTNSLVTFTNPHVLTCA